METTKNEIPADLTHIKFVQGGMEEQMKIGALLGKLRIAITLCHALLDRCPVHVLDDDLFLSPVLFGRGHGLQCPMAIQASDGHNFVGYALIAIGMGMLLTIILVNLFPARQTKDIAMYLALCFGIFIVVIFRMMRPEDLANSNKYGYFLDYLSSISTPAGHYVPAAWAANMISLYLLDKEVDWLLVGLLFTTPVAVYILGKGAMEWWFFSGFTKSQESFGGYRRFVSRRPYRPRIREWWIYTKEAISFLRDSTEWAQLFMIGALIIGYRYNFEVLPMGRSYMKEKYLANLLAFLNIGLTGFVITSLSVRFVFPSIGAEGGSFYLLRTSPLSMGRFLFHKYLFYVSPFTCLSLFLVLVSSHLLRVQGPIW